MTDYAFFAGMAVVFGILIIIGVALYLLFAFGLFKMAKNQRIEQAWLAFIPIVQLYIIGLLVGDKITIFDNEFTNLGVILVVASLASLVLSFIPFIGILFTLAYLALFYYVLYNLFVLYEENAVLYLVLSIIVPFLLPVFVFMMREKHPRFV